MIKRHLLLLAWTVIGILLFSLSFPGYFNQNGIPIIAFFSLFPLFYITSKINYRESIFYGFIYGSGTYLLFNYWLASFDPVSFSVAPTIIGFYYILLFLLCRYIFNNFKRFSYIPLLLAWLAFEMFKGENLIGYTYGTLAHTMYRTHLFTGIADITGTYIISLLIAFPAIYIVTVIRDGGFNLGLKKIFKPIIIYLIFMIISITYTFIQKVDYSMSKELKVSLIQHNLDSWAKGSNALYRSTLDNLLELSTEAQKSDPDLVVWSETAFVPAIEWHKKYKSDSFRLNLVNEMESFTGRYSADYIIGANETIGEHVAEQIKYNSVYQYVGTEPVSKYRKIKLVPFTESFPHPKLLPWLNTYIKSIGGKDLTPGKEQVNFNSKGIKITPLICYEDSFYSIAREGIKSGGDILVNVTNDAWSKESACSLQHLSASLFRSLENRRSFIRVGNGGYSCVIDPNGKILASLPILTKSQMTFDVPIYSKELTFYTKYGNIISNVLLVIFGIILIIKIVMSILPVLQVRKKLNL